MPAFYFIGCPVCKTVLIYSNNLLEASPITHQWWSFYDYITFAIIFPISFIVCNLHNKNTITNDVPQMIQISIGVGLLHALPPLHCIQRLVPYDSLFWRRYCIYWNTKRELGTGSRQSTVKDWIESEILYNEASVLRRTCHSSLLSSHLSFWISVSLNR